jgi:diacylglycerol kinase (ATP)
VVGNLGELQGGTRLLPDADPYDGVLDAAVVGPVGLAGWLRVAARVVSGGRRQDARMERLQFRRLELTIDRAQPHELDGDCGQAVTAVDFAVVPGALTVRVPAQS